MSEATVLIEQLEVPLQPWIDGPRRSVDRGLTPTIAQALGIRPDQVSSYHIDRRSLDARHKPDLRFIYRLTAQVDPRAGVREGKGISVLTEPLDQSNDLFHLPLQRDLPQQPVIVGTGPAGIMAAYLLALHGCKPLILDRGQAVEQRGADLASFHDSRELNPDSNYLFGEGGAGTYSDGKLYTRVKDRRMRFLLDAFVAARAPADIRFVHHPHIGSDILPHMARRLREQIEAWGGSFRWGTTVTDIIIENGSCVGVQLDTGEKIRSDCTLIGAGHSARDLSDLGRTRHRTQSKRFSAWLPNRT